MKTDKEAEKRRKMIEKREKEEEERRRKKEEEERLASISGEDEAVEFVTRKIGAAVSPFPLRTNLGAAKTNEDAMAASAAGADLLSPQGGTWGEEKLASIYLIIPFVSFFINFHLLL